MIYTQLFSLENKTAIITGGARGIGKIFAESYCSMGARVAICDINEQDLQETKDEFNIKGYEILCCHADITDAKQRQSFIDAVWNTYGDANILVNNAAFFNPATTFTQSEEDWDKTFEVGLKATFFMSQYFASKLIEEKKPGRIINMASQGGIRGKLPGVDYACMKAGIIHMTKLLAYSLAEHGILVNAISPGFTKTKINEAIRNDPIVGPKNLASIPVGRYAEPADHVGALLYLSSNASAYVTGHTICVDGGTTIA